MKYLSKKTRLSSSTPLNLKNKIVKEFLVNQRVEIK